VIIPNLAVELRYFLAEQHQEDGETYDAS